MDEMGGEQEPVLAAAAACLSMDSQTPPDDEEEEMAPADSSQSGLGGAGLTEEERLANIAAASAAEVGVGDDQYFGLTGNKLLDL